MPAILNKPSVHGFIYAACLATMTCQACTSAELQAIMLYQAQKTSSAPMLPVDTSLWSMSQLVSNHYAVSMVRNPFIFLMCSCCWLCACASTLGFTTHDPSCGSSAWYQLAMLAVGLTRCSTWSFLDPSADMRNDHRHTAHGQHCGVSGTPATSCADSVLL